MATNKVALQVRLDEKVHAKLRIVAEEEVRSLNSQIEYFVIRCAPFQTFSLPIASNPMAVHCR